MFQAITGQPELGDRTLEQVPLYPTVMPVARQLDAKTFSESTGKGWEVQSGFNINWVYQGNDTVKFTFVIPDNTWLGLMLGSSTMRNADIIQVSANGQKSQFYDLYSTGSFKPSQKDSNELTGNFTVDQGFVTFDISRRLDPMLYSNSPKDTQHYVLELDKKTTFSYAIQSQNSDVAYVHNAVSSFTNLIDSKGGNLNHKVTLNGVQLSFLTCSTLLTILYLLF